MMADRALGLSEAIDEQRSTVGSVALHESQGDERDR